MHRKVIIVGMTPGELAGSLDRGYRAPVMMPRVIRSLGSGIRASDEHDQVMLDARGNPVTEMRYGVRPRGTWGPDDPGDDGRPTIRLRVAFWYPVLGRRIAIRNFRSAVTAEGPGGITLDELAALRAGALVEEVIDEAGGQLDFEISGDETRRVLLDVWERRMRARAMAAAPNTNLLLAGPQ